MHPHQQGLRRGARQLPRVRRFAAIASLTLSLVVGVNAVLSVLVTGDFDRPLPAARHEVTLFGASEEPREIDVRVALSALRRQAVGSVIRGGTRVVMTAVWECVALSLAIAALVSAMFVGLSPSDLPIVAAIGALLGGAVLYATGVHARRAARRDAIERRRGAGAGGSGLRG